jgi:FtsP/CotA-like multicopper oxidase with cupredoxin domain
LGRSFWQRIAAAAACLVLIASMRPAATPQTTQAQTPQTQPPQGTTRTYYIAADELDWNYMPGGRDGMMGMGMAPQGYAKLFAQRGLHQLGSVYRKAIYREYTDATFTHLKPRPPQDAYLGIVGPIIHAEVGDTIVVVFRNHGTRPYSMHPHGVTYAKASEGSDYNDGVDEAAKGGDSVAPGATFTYRWNVLDSAGPGPADPSSIVWLYHSHVVERKDVNAGLIGAIVVTRRGMARPDGTPKDVDREFVSFFISFDENDSWFSKSNIQRFALNPKKYNRLESAPLDPQGDVDILIGQGSIPQNVRNSINGYQFADGPMPKMHLGEHVRWYLLSLGEGVNFHTPHWHGNTVIVNGQRTDVLSLAPAQMITADMVPNNPGIWMFHCHLSEHMESGMSSLYDVLP